ncbi:hypothetical protein LDC_0237, partial [sediment metagenome]
MPVGLRGYLWQMGDAKHLAALAQLAQHAADDFRDATADADIDFVKNQRTCGIGLAGDHLQGQPDARQFAARSHLGQG